MINQTIFCTRLQWSLNCGNTWVIKVWYSLKKHMCLETITFTRDSVIQNHLVILRYQYICDRSLSTDMIDLSLGLLHPQWWCADQSQVFLFQDRFSYWYIWYLNPGRSDYTITRISSKYYEINTSRFLLLSVTVKHKLQLYKCSRRRWKSADTDDSWSQSQWSFFISQKSDTTTHHKPCYTSEIKSQCRMMRLYICGLIKRRGEALSRNRDRVCSCWWHLSLSLTVGKSFMCWCPNIQSSLIPKTT